MESYTRSNASWQSHSAAVDQMKEHIMLEAAGEGTKTVIQYINKNQISARSNGCKEQEWR
jgi:hypothetical protein